MTRNLDTQTFVVLGEGLAAGVGHFSLTEDVQEWSFPALAAEKLGATFDQPLLEAPGVTRPLKSIASDNSTRACPKSQPMSSWVEKSHASRLR